MTFNSYNNCKLKVKLWWVGAHKRKKRTFFVHFVLSEGNFLKICFISCIVHSVLNTLSEYTYLYISKTITSYTSVACFYNPWKLSVYSYGMWLLDLKVLYGFLLSRIYIGYVLFTLPLYCLVVSYGCPLFEGILHNFYLPLRLFFPVFCKVWHLVNFKIY